MRVGKSA